MKRFGLLLALALVSCSLQANVPQNAHIRITGEGVVNAMPDQVTFQLAVRAEQNTALAAKQAVDERVNALLAELEGFEIARRDVKAAQLITQPRYDYDREGGRALAGYEASRSLSITLKNVAQMSTFMDTVLAVGIDEIQSIQMGVSDRTALEQAALNQAIANAKLQAEAIAEQFDTELGSVYSVDVSSGSARGQYGGVERILVSGSRMQDSVGQYLQENMEVKAVVHVVFNLE